MLVAFGNSGRGFNEDRLDGTGRRRGPGRRIGPRSRTIGAEDGMRKSNPAPDSAERLAFLRRQATQTVETHMSWVFMTGEQVLKLKKSVRYPFLDFSTLAAREHFCREELRLNARLAPGVYLGLTALGWDGRELRLLDEPVSPPGVQVLDWLVRMRRLPADRMLDRLLAEGGVTPAQIDAVAAVLERFYAGALRVALTPAELLGRLQREQAAHREVLLRPQFQVAGAGLALDRTDLALRRGAALLGERATGGALVDGHGDLRPEHLCLLEPPVIIDALEFNPAMRQVDPFDELAFLALECEMAGAAWVGPRLVAGCRAALGGDAPAGLWPLYTALRALLRARLALAHLLDPAPRTPGRWAPMAERYVARALAALDAFDAELDAFDAERVAPRPLSAATRRGSP
jgi:aminoglycoside phosphotransferase family enzyme